MNKFAAVINDKWLISVTAETSDNVHEMFATVSGISSVVVYHLATVNPARIVPLLCDCSTVSLEELVAMSGEFVDRMNEVAYQRAELVSARELYAEKQRELEEARRAMEEAERAVREAKQIADNAAEFFGYDNQDDD